MTLEKSQLKKARESQSEKIDHGMIGLGMIDHAFETTIDMYHRLETAILQQTKTVIEVEMMRDAIEIEIEILDHEIEAEIVIGTIDTLEGNTSDTDLVETTTAANHVTIDMYQVKTEIKTQRWMIQKRRREKSRTRSFHHIVMIGRGQDQEIVVVVVDGIVHVPALVLVVLAQGQEAGEETDRGRGVGGEIVLIHVVAEIVNDRLSFALKSKPE